MAKKKSKCYSLSDKAIEKVLEVQKEHDFESESAALEYILVQETNMKELVYNTVIKILNENNLSFNNKPLEIKKEEIKVFVDEEAEKFLNDAYSSMPD